MNTQQFHLDHGGGDVTRTLSVRYDKDGSEILLSQGDARNSRRLIPREYARLMGFPPGQIQDSSLGYADHKQFADASVVTMIETIGESITSLTPINKSPDKISDVTVPENIVTKGFWTKEQTKLAFSLYCQIPYGRIHSRNPEIITLSKIIGRTPDAVAMKMLNIASLDPVIIKSGRAGLGNASNLDRAVWEEFDSNWEAVATECTLIFQQLSKSETSDSAIDEVSDFLMQDFTGETRQVLTYQRIKQNFFRRSVLSSYRGRCCMSGLSDSRLLVASHIIPWSVDKANRLNPSNGLCLSAIHDKAFDKGLLSLSDSGEVLISDELRRVDDNFMKNIFLSLENKVIEMPEKFAPNIAFLKHHRNNIFIN